MPECINYINELRLEAFSACITQIREQWIKDTSEKFKKQGVLDDQHSAFVKTLNSILTDYIIDEFDNFWSIASNVFTNDAIADVLGANYHCRKLSRSKILANIRKPRVENILHEQDVQLFAKMMKGYGINIPTRFYYDQLNKRKDFV